MREIEFRGKSNHNCEYSLGSIEKNDWVYGYYYYCRTRQCGIIVTILEGESGGVGSGLVQVEIEVDYKTVGQYIGRKDKNDKKIYAGDIVQCEISFKGGSLPHMGEIVYMDEFGAFATKNQAGETLLHNHLLNTFEVIGNSDDNPELLREEK